MATQAQQYQNTPETRSWKKLSPATGVLLIIAPFVIQAAMYLKQFVQLLLVHNDSSYPEAASVYAFLSAARTGHLYSSPLAFPWNEQMYGPLFYLAGSGIAKLVHGDATLTTIIARIVVFASFLGAVALIAYLTWFLERKARWTAAAAVLGIACAWAIPFCASARPDGPSILLIVAAAALYLIGEGRTKYVFAAGLLGALAFLTKQSTAPVLIALLVDTALSKKLRDTVALAAGSVLPTVAMFSALWLRHEPFLENFAAVGHAILDRATILHTATSLIRTNQMAVIPIAIAILGITARFRMQRYRAVLLMVACAVISNLAALANTGGDANYLILPWLLLLLMVPAGLEKIESWSGGFSRAPVVLCLLGLMLVVHQRNLLVGKPLQDLETQNVSKWKVLTDVPYIEIRSAEPQYLDPFYFSQLAMQKSWSHEPLLQRINAERYDLILVAVIDRGPNNPPVIENFRGTSFWNSDVLEEMNQHYRVLCSVPKHVAMVPRDRATAVTGDDVATVFHQSCEQTGQLPVIAQGLY